MKTSKTMKETIKLSAGFLVGFLANRYVAKSAMITKLLPDNPSYASVIASSGITFGVSKLGNKIPDKTFALGLLGGSGARTAVEILQVPMVSEKLPTAVNVMLYGDQGTLSGDSVTVGADQMEAYLEAEAEKRAREIVARMIPGATLEGEEEEVIEEETETDEGTFGGNGGAFDDV